MSGRFLLDTNTVIAIFPEEPDVLERLDPLTLPSPPDGSRWLSAPPGFLFPVRALAQVFRGTYLDPLRCPSHAGKLVFATSTALLGAPGAFAEWLALSWPTEGRL